MIRIRGARTHNLQDVDLDLSVGRLIVMTGVSGSGKSSLAVDTLFAEGQRRYLESVSVRTRSLIRNWSRPDVDEITGLPPTICLDQRAGVASVRSTLAVTTEIHDHLRLLYARAGCVHCTSCGREVHSQSLEQITARVMQLPERTRLLILSPMVRARRGAHRDVLERIERFGFVRARIDGELVDLADLPELAPGRAHTIEAVVDRLIVRPGLEQRLRESLDLACREGSGTCVVSREDGGAWRDELFSIRFCCPDCELSFPTPEPHNLSFHSAFGACPDCEGLGIRGLAEQHDDLTLFRRTPCATCDGTRLQPLGRSITFLGQTISEFCRQSVDEALQATIAWLHTTQSTEVSASHRAVAGRTLPAIRQRLEALSRTGLGYLTLDRPSRSLSGGEYQRARLAACLGTGLHGACFVLDEPTAGLHPRDTQRLLELLHAIRDAGSTVVVVEHDGDVMRAADWLVDLGPGAGVDGGQVLFSGRPGDYPADHATPTAVYLSGRPSVKLNRDNSGFQAEQPVPAGSCLAIRGARLNNLRDLTVTLPTGQLVCVTGVSGSGKSSLILDTLLPVADAASQPGRDTKSVAADVCCDGIDGLESIRRVVAAEALTAGRSRRSCVATISRVWSQFRRLLAATREARARGFSSAQFGFNSGPGRCHACLGTGQRSLRMAFLPDAVVTCPECHGQRFDPETLQVRFQNHTAADILAMRVDEVVDVFGEFESIRQLLTPFHDIGLGYLTLGQPASTFSGGEMQRARLAAELAGDHNAATLFILDEPTRGLHPADITRLIKILTGLTAAHHTVVVTEHNPDVILQADRVIDLGPDGGPDGGTVMFQGTPQRLLLAAGHTADAVRAATGTARHV